MIELWETERYKQKRNLQFCERFWKLLGKKMKDHRRIKAAVKQVWLCFLCSWCFDFLFLNPPRHTVARDHFGRQPRGPLYLWHRLGWPTVKGTRQKFFTYLFKSGLVLLRVLLAYLNVLWSMLIKLQNYKIQRQVAEP